MSHLVASTRRILQYIALLCKIYITISRSIFVSITIITVCWQCNFFALFCFDFFAHFHLLTQFTFLGPHFDFIDPMTTLSAFKQQSSQAAKQLDKQHDSHIRKRRPHVTVTCPTRCRHTSEIQISIATKKKAKNQTPCREYVQSKVLSVVEYHEQRYLYKFVYKF